MRGACAGQPAPAAPARQAGPPPRESWHAEPVKVFDNLYFVGETGVSAWAVTTSAGIIIIDPIFDYSVEDEVVGGLRKLGLDPATIKYVLVSHAHYDHVGGAAFLQDRFNARVVLSAADWDLLSKSDGTWRKPKRDMVATDGQKLTLGDTTLTLHLTPGHTLGTISTLIPVTRSAACRTWPRYWGGTAFNWVGESRRLHHAGASRQLLVRVLHRLGAALPADSPPQRGADVIMSNHTNFDGSKTKLPAMATRKPGDPHPYVVGPEAVARYLTVAEECAKAGKLRVR